MISLQTAQLCLELLSQLRLDPSADGADQTVQLIQQAKRELTGAANVKQPDDRKPAERKPPKKRR